MSTTPTMMTREEFGALKKSIQRSLKDVKEGELPPDAAELLEDGELTSLICLTDSLIYDVDLQKRKLGSQEDQTRTARAEVERLEIEIRELKRVLPIIIVVLALLQLWVCFLAGATLEWKLAYLRQWHFCIVTSAISAIFAFALIVWAGSHETDRWYR